MKRGFDGVRIVSGRVITLRHTICLWAQGDIAAVALNVLSREKGKDLHDFDKI